VPHYIGLIHKESKSDYGVSFPDLPGCITAGRTLDEGRAMAEEALALHLEGLAADGDPIPDPSSMEAVMSDARNRDAVAILVPARLPAGRVARVNITVPVHALGEIDRFAAEHGFTRSGFLVSAARRAMRESPAPQKKRRASRR
jgi:predicted RNase H-like HicB family nuclease